MALTISVREGDSFYVNDTQCLVSQLHDPSRMKIDVCLPVTKRYEVNARVKTEIMPGVFVQTGKQWQDDETGQMKPTILVEASRDKMILREKLYKRKQREQQQRNG